MATPHKQRQTNKLIEQQYMFSFVYFWNSVVIRICVGKLFYLKLKSKAKQKNSSLHLHQLQNGGEDTTTYICGWNMNSLQRPFIQITASGQLYNYTRKKQKQNAALISIPLYINEMNKITMIKCH